MSNPTWTPELGPKISAAWHAIRDCLTTNGRVDERTLIAVATSTGIVEKTATNLLADLRNHGYVSRRKGTYLLRANVPAPGPARVTPSSSSPAGDLSQASPAAVERLHQGMEVGRVCYPVPLNDRNPDVLWCVSHRGDWTERGCREAVRLADLAVGGEVGALQAEVQRLLLLLADETYREEGGRIVVGQLMDERRKREAAERRLAAVEALADEWEADGPHSAFWGAHTRLRMELAGGSVPDEVARLRGVVAEVERLVNRWDDEHHAEANNKTTSNDPSTLRLGQCVSELNLALGGER